MKDANHFGSFQELYRFLNASPQEPKEYEPPKEEKKKKKKGKKDEVLQAD